MCLASGNTADAQQRRILEETFSTVQVAEFGKGVAVGVGVSHSNGNYIPLASGFWATESGMVVTSYRALMSARFSLHANVVSPSVTMHLAPFAGSLLQLGGGAMKVGATIKDLDEPNDLALLYVPMSPWKRGLHLVASAEARTGAKEAVNEKYWIARRASRPPREGAQLMIVSVERDNDTPDIPAVSIREAKSVRLSLTQSGWRIRLQTPFQNHLPGAAVLNEKREVVGMITMDRTYPAALSIVPAETITKFLVRSGAVRE